MANVKELLDGYDLGEEESGEKKELAAIEPEVVQAEVVETHSDEGGSFASQTVYSEDIVPISETAEKLYQLLEKKSFDEVSAAAEVDFNPTDDVAKLDAVIENLEGKISRLMSMDVEQLMRNRLVGTMEAARRSIKVDGGDGDISDAILEDFDEIDPESVILCPVEMLEMENKISLTVDRYTKQLKDLIKERRLLSGQLYGTRSGGAELMKRKVSMSQSVLRNKLIEQSRQDRLKGIGSGGKAKEANGLKGSFPGLIGGAPVKND